MIVLSMEKVEINLTVSKELWLKKKSTAINKNM